MQALQQEDEIQRGTQLGLQLRSRVSGGFSILGIGGSGRLMFRV